MFRNERPQPLPMLVVILIGSWFELECAEAQIRAGRPGLAMKKALAVHTHFEDFVEDQFDFHTYCMRKVCRMCMQSSPFYIKKPEKEPEVLEPLCIRAPYLVFETFSRYSMVGSIALCVHVVSYSCQVENKGNPLTK